MANNRGFKLTIGTQNALAVGSYDVVVNPRTSAQASISILSLDGSSDPSGTAEAGALEITSVSDGYITGTFSVTSWDRQDGEITSGQFSVATLVEIVPN